MTTVETPRGRHPIAAALAGTIPISMTAIFYRLSEADPVTGGFFRMLYAVPILGVMWWWIRRRDTRSMRERSTAWIAGAFLGLDLISWQTSIDLIGAGLGTLIANSQAVIVPLATWALFKERPSNAALGAMPLVMIGLVFITGLGRGDTYGDRPAAGVALAVLAACLYSGYLVAYRRSNRSLAPTVGPLLDVSIASTVTLGIYGTVGGQLDLVPSWPMHGWLLLMALGPQVLGWMAISYALPRLPAAHTSFAILMQPVMTLVWGRILLDETPSLTQLAGVALVLAGIAAVTVAGTRATR